MPLPDGLSHSLPLTVGIVYNRNTISWFEVLQKTKNKKGKENTSDELLGCGAPSFRKRTFSAKSVLRTSAGISLFSGRAFLTG